MKSAAKTNKFNLLDFYYKHLRTEKQRRKVQKSIDFLNSLSAEQQEFVDFYASSKFEAGFEFGQEAVEFEINGI